MFLLKIENNKSKIENGFVLPLVLAVMTILVMLSIGAMMVSYNSRLQAVQTKAQTEAMLAAEAGYERAIFWMCEQTDILGALQDGAPGSTGNIDFGTGTCSYKIDFHGYIGSRPVFEVSSTGISGRPTFTRVVDVNIIQETCGWAEGSCRIPNGTSSTTPVYFGNGEVISMPVHINDFRDNPDKIDIWIDSTNGSPRFLQQVEMGESRKTSAGSDKYSSVMSCFQAGIIFDQPDVRITNESAVQSKINRFRDSTLTAFKFEPNGTARLRPDPCCSAVQLEFFVAGGVGKVRITNHCTVDVCAPGPSDYNIVPGTGGSTFHQYKIYAYHYARNPNDVNFAPKTYNIADTYVSQHFGGYTSDPGGQIYVNGNVIIGGANTVDINQVVKGKITVVASGNIWIADSIKVDDNGGTLRGADGMPTAGNPNVLGLIAQGFVKIVDPGLSKAHGVDVNSWVKDNYYPTDSAKRHYYQPIGIKKNVGDSLSNRYLLNPTVVEAAITCGGGGWGAENVNTSSGRKLFTGPQDDLYVRGSITEVVRGIVGHLGSDGYVKHYYADPRLMSGILPGDIWFSGKYIPAPAGWHDRSYRD